MTIPTNQHKDLPITIQNAITNKHRLRSLWQRNRNPDLKRKFNHQAEIVRNSLKNYRSDLRKLTIENLKSNDPKLFKINRSLISKKPATRPLLGPNGLVFDPEKMANLFASELEVQFSCPSGTDAINNYALAISSILDQPHVKEIPHFSPNEVWEVIKTLTKRKAPGPDQITNTALKKISKRTILHLTEIYNYCLRFEHFPAPWKTTNVIMIPKSGKNNLIPTNHRPISLLNTIAKTFGILLLTRLKKATAPLIRPEQYTFRNGHSTTIQLTGLIDKIARTVNKKERTAAVFLDFAKAFDKGGILACWRK